MAASPTLTPDDVIARLRDYIADGNDQGALDYWRTVWPTLQEHITSRQLLIASGLLSSAERAVDYVGIDETTHDEQAQRRR